MTPPFDYPLGPRVRRHAPAGYASYEGFRPWLRDEFSFRCAYCLWREQWGRVANEFAIDHFLPAAFRPDLAATYDNLVYSCMTCNSRKRDLFLPDPCLTLTADAIHVDPSGVILGRTRGLGG